MRLLLAIILAIFLLYVAVVGIINTLLEAFTRCHP